MKLSFYLITKLLVFFFVLLTLQANALQIGDKAPNFKADTTLGKLDFYDWSQDQWIILLSHPGDFTPVCTTELAEAAKLQPLLKKKNAKILTLSADSVEDHLEWVEVINNYKNKTTTTDDLKNLFLGTEGDTDVNFPIISDPDLEVATLYGMYHPKALPNASSLGGENKSTIRAVFIIDPKKNIQAMLTYPKNIGRNFSEIVRTLEALQVSSELNVSTPANWEFGDDVIVSNDIPDEDIKEKYEVDEYNVFETFLRTIKQPGHYDGNDARRNRVRN
ncbi:redoxin domain-containing protein [Methylophilales bacterium]|nr:redoxin domain-containing protein [Methylophilales bacterium]